jgi:hypothetical protein
MAHPAALNQVYGHSISPAWMWDMKRPSLLAIGQTSHNIPQGWWLKYNKTSFENFVREIVNSGNITFVRSTCIHCGACAIAGSIGDKILLWEEGVHICSDSTS